ncbi:hypothetical protein ACPCSP_25390 [Streptomyces cinereoruber]|uniref:hypothetical protein n=1 Tax=Streptomyces cinereoruber TaxID=67260 RepID=UPI003C308FC7
MPGLLMELPDLVVPVREVPVNEQLRYAVRSWAQNLPHRRLWVVGYRPWWLDGAEHIPTRQAGTKYANTTAAVRAACEHPEVSENFLLLNDDFFVMDSHPDGMPVLHRGPVRQVEAYYANRASGDYLRGMRQTRALLADLGHDDPLSYELHVPLPVDKAGMLDVLNLGEDVPVLHKRTAYGTLADLGGEQIEDVKIMHRDGRFPKASPYLSTMPDSFTHGQVGAHIRQAFPEPCAYETGSP